MVKAGSPLLLQTSKETLLTFILSISAAPEASVCLQFECEHAPKLQTASFLLTYNKEGDK